VRMHADGGVDERITLGLLDGHIQQAASADGHHQLHAGGQGALDDLRAVGIELRVVEVTMRVHQAPFRQAHFRQAHFRRAPTGMSSWKPARTGLPPSTDAATIIPLDSMPFSLRGCKFATMTTWRLSSCSGVLASAMPATMVRGSASPMSTFMCM